MSAPFVDNDMVSGPIDFDFAESVTGVFAPGRPINVRRLVLVIKEASNGAETITVGVRNKDDTSSVTKGTFPIPSGAVLNAVYKVDIAASYTAAQTGDGGGISQPATVTTGRVVGYQTSLPGEIQVNPGQELFFTSTGGTATTGQADVYVEYREEGNNPTRFNATAAVFTLA